MSRIGICTLALLAMLLSACGKKEDAASLAPASVPAPALAPAASAPAPEIVKTATPDFGGVTKVSREVEGVGSTQELAVVAALQSAVAQVNGVRVASQLQSMRAGLDLSVNGQGAGSARAEAFTQKLIAASQGAITGFEILSQEEIDKVDETVIARVRASDGGYSYSASAQSEGKASAEGSTHAEARASLGAGADVAGGKASGAYSRSVAYSESANIDVKRGSSAYESDASYKKMRSYWKVRVRADVAQYKAPDEQGRPKIVVALPKTLAASYAVGDSRVKAAEVAQAVRGRLSDILTQTKRFIVLDREFSSELQAEIDHINSGNVRVQDSARLGQQLATDLILIPTVERFEYPKSVRQLRMSDRQLVSYSGGGRITLRLINAATGEVVMSNSFDHQLAPTDPSTLPRVIDGGSMAANMMASLSEQIGSAIVTEIFPVSVISMKGDQAVLSQGGEALKPGQRWQAVHLGEELKDPQTGRSLGRDEMPLGVIRIDRVSAQTSYGTLEEGEAALAGKPFRPGAIVLRQKLTGRAMAANKAEPRTDTPGTAQMAPSQAHGAPRPVPRRQAAPVEAPAVAPARREDDKW